MKKFVYTVLFLLIFSFFLHGEILSFRIAPKLNIPLKNFDEQDPPESLPVPSLGFYYNSTFAIGAELRYFHELNGSEEISPVFLTFLTIIINCRIPRSYLMCF
ncbi:MAG: hypothetical protein K9M99_06220 [Candidatus Cloacimonetes bacterium]|nr:hypothetical protein [Candidatus Cloacimonadota bacterium]